MVSIENGSFGRELYSFPGLSLYRRYKLFFVYRVNFVLLALCVVRIFLSVIGNFVGLFLGVFGGLLAGWEFSCVVRGMGLGRRMGGPVARTRHVGVTLTCVNGDRTRLTESVNAAPSTFGREVGASGFATRSLRGVTGTVGTRCGTTFIFPSNARVK